jgi:hypothetical protein
MFMGLPDPDLDPLVKTEDNVSANKNTKFFLRP